MPGGDRTGPAGMGPMTGRRAGYCAGNTTPGAMNLGFGRGYGPGFGRGLGLGFRGGRWGRWAGPYVPYGAPFSPFVGRVTRPQQELEALQADAAFLRDSLESVTKRIAELEARNKEE
jgi:hypothetical protein